MPILQHRSHRLWNRLERRIRTAGQVFTNYGSHGGKKFRNILESRQHATRLPTNASPVCFHFAVCVLARRPNSRISSEGVWLLLKCLTPPEGTMYFFSGARCSEWAIRRFTCLFRVRIPWKVELPYQTVPGSCR